MKIRNSNRIKVETYYTLKGKKDGESCYIWNTEDEQFLEHRIYNNGEIIYTGK